MKNKKESNKRTNFIFAGFISGFLIINVTGLIEDINFRLNILHNFLKKIPQNGGDYSAFLGKNAQLL